jgi:hypothetical protein
MKTCEKEFGQILQAYFLLVGCATHIVRIILKKNY